MEQKLIEQAKNGSREAFCELYSMYKDQLYRYALYKLGDPDDAEDAVSDCVLAAWKGISGIRNPAAFKTWIFRILRNCCAGSIRSKVAMRDNLERIYLNGSQTGSDPSVAVELREALDQLRPDEREVVLLAVVAGLNSREISEITGLTSGSSRSKLSRSLAKMREYLT